jgi:hypothetical protein
MSGNRVKSGGKIKLRGAALGNVTRVVFRGARGARDDATVGVDPTSDRSVAVPVPYRANTGPIDVWAGKKVRASSSSSVKIMPPPAPLPNPELTRVPVDPEAGAPLLETATSRSLFALGQRRGVAFSFRVANGAAETAEVALVHVDDGSVVKTWAPEIPSGDGVAKVAWNGMIGSRQAPDGRYAFRLTVTGAGGARAVNAAAGDARRDAFDLRPALFPVRGRHNYGQSGARFGAGRSGHSHQGHDVMAACGTPLIAARGGVIKVKQYHSAAGNYLVIDGFGTGVDHAYMHLASPSPYNEGDKVYTGDQIGVVGTTGSSSACHLHFEQWSAPGWYDGGQPFDPLADLRAWDSWS